MNTYEYGASVANRDRIRTGRDPQPPKTFVCVPDCAENLSMDEAFAQMCEVLSSKGIGVVNMQMPDAITANGDVYTLAHEKVLIKTGEVLVKPSNLLRFILGRTFTKDTLYLDENGEVVELHNGAMRDIGNGSLGLTGEFNTMVEVNPNIISDCMYEMVKGAYLNDRLSDTLSRLPAWIKPITVVEGSLAECLKAENLMTFLRYMNDYKSVRNYYVDRCGLVFTATLDPSKITVKPTEKLSDPKPLAKKAPPKWSTPPSPLTGGGSRSSAGQRITVNHSFGLGGVVTTVNAAPNIYDGAVARPDYIGATDSVAADTREPDMPVMPPKSPYESFSEYVRRVQPIVNQRNAIEQQRIAKILAGQPLSPSTESDYLSPDIDANGTWA